MPDDFLLTLFRTQPVHSKRIVTRVSLLLAMKPPFGFEFTPFLYFIFRSKTKTKKEKLEVANELSKS